MVVHPKPDLLYQFQDRNKVLRARIVHGHDKNYNDFGLTWIECHHFIILNSKEDTKNMMTIMHLRFGTKNV